MYLQSTPTNYLYETAKSAKAFYSVYQITDKKAQNSSLQRFSLARKLTLFLWNNHVFPTLLNYYKPNREVNRTTHSLKHTIQLCCRAFDSHEAQPNLTSTNRNLRLTICTRSLIRNRRSNAHIKLRLQDACGYLVLLCELLINRRIHLPLKYKWIANPFFERRHTKCSSSDDQQCVNFTWKASKA